MPDPEIDIDEFIGPRDDIEKGIFDIVSELLGIDDFGVNTDLFKMGLTSLTVVQLVSAIADKFNKQLMITEIMKCKSIDRIAKLITFEEEEVRDIQEFYPVTQNQLGIYFDCLKNTEKLSYNLSKKVDFGFKIDSDKLKAAIIEAIDNHPYLKTIIVMKDGEVYQKRRDDFNIDDAIEIVHDYDENDFLKPFVLDEGPLFRFKIVDDSILLADFHHIIVDGTSLNILFDEIASIYDGKDYELEEMDGFDYSLSESKAEQSSLYEEAKLFFFNKIKEFDEATVISPDLKVKRKVV